MANNTKILRYDLDRDLQNVFEQLDKLKKEKGSIDLYEIFTNIDFNMLGPDEQKVILDLIVGSKKTGYSVTDRIEKLEKRKGYSVDSMIEGDYNEAFQYNADGEIIQHKATGDVNFVTNYGYGPLIPVGTSSAVTGVTVLTTSTSTFISSEGRNVQVKKTYKYDASENIVAIETDTIMDVTPPGSVRSVSTVTGIGSDGKPFVKVSWTKPTDTDYKHVNFYMTDTNTGEIVDVQMRNTTSPLTWPIAKLKENTVYTIVMKTVDTSDNEQTVGLAVSYRTPSR